MYILSLPNHTHEKLGKGPFCTSDLRVIFTHQPRRPLRLKMAMFAARPNAISGVQQDRAEFGNSNHASTKIIQTLVICKWKSLNPSHFPPTMNCVQFLYIIQKVKSQRLPYKDIISHCEALHPNILWPFAKRHKMITISFKHNNAPKGYDWTRM